MMKELVTFGGALKIGEQFNQSIFFAKVVLFLNFTRDKNMKLKSYTLAIIAITAVLGFATWYSSAQMSQNP